MNGLDLKDRKILYELDVDSRQSFHSIAKKVGLSKDSVIYRVNKLAKAGIIRQFHVVIDTGRLDLISFRLYLKFQNTTPEKEKEIIGFLKMQGNVTWIVSIDGEYDVGMWVLCRRIGEMRKLWKEILGRYRDFIERRWLTIFSRVSYFPRAYILGKETNDEEYVFISGNESAGADRTDIEILDILSMNARTPAVEIAKRLGITAKTVVSRIRRMEKEGIIVGYRTMFDIGKLGYQYFKIHLNVHNLSEEREKQLRGYIKRHPNIIYDNEVLGGDDFEIEVQVRSLNELRAVIEEIKSLFSDVIRNYRYMIFYREHKFVFLPEGFRDYFAKD